jgi:hypothetical protein
MDDVTYIVGSNVNMTLMIESNCEKNYFKFILNYKI